MKHDLPAGREAAKRWWLHVAKSKERPQWQLEQWQQAIRWFLAWLEVCNQKGVDARSLPERLKDAVHHAGARRGLAYQTRKTYAGWLARYGVYAQTQERVMDESVGRDWLTHLVKNEQVAYATQKQALNALVFFYRDVCDRKEVNLQIRMRKTQRRQPVILDKEEVMRLIGKLEPHYRLPAMLQFGAGLRLKELTSIRIKDVDTSRGVLTIHAGKGDKDRLTIIPNCLKPTLDQQIREARKWWEIDRENNHPGVCLPGALARKMPKAGERWEWFWLFPADHLSRDPQSNIIRRHHLLPSVYAKAISRAAQAAEIPKRVTTHALRHAFATQLLQNGTDIRTLQDLLGHADVKTTEIYAHAVQIGNDKAIRSPLDQSHTMIHMLEHHKPSKSLEVS